MALVDTRHGRQDHRAMPESAAPKRGLPGRNSSCTRRWPGRANRFNRRQKMNLILWVIVFLLLFGAVGSAPNFGYWHHDYGYYPSGGMGLLLVIVVLILLFGRRGPP
jgi:hypothetical protein